MAYKPRYPGDRITTEWTYAELQRIAQGMYQPDILQFDRRGYAPRRPQEGTLALANGFTWNPSGSISSTTAAGLHIYLNGAWQRIAHGGGAGLVSVRDYGAVGNGVANDQPAIQAALNDPAADHVYFPAGDYLVNSSLTCSHIGKTLFSFNPQSTRIITNATNINILTFTGGFNQVRGIGFNGFTTITAGWVLSLLGGQSTAENCYFTGFFNGIQSTGAVNRILNSELRNGYAGGTAIAISGGDTSQLIDNVLVHSADSVRGIFTDNNAALIVSNTSILECDTCVLMAPGSGQNIFSNKFINCFFDTAINGIRINPSATSGVYRSQFINCWTGSHTEYGVSLITDANSTIDGMDFISHETYLNGLDGFLITGTNVANTQLVDCRFSNNSGAGLSINNGGRRVRVHHCYFGAGYGLNNNSFGDVFIAATVSAVSILDCTFNHPTVQISLGSDQHIARNRGYRTKAQGRASISAAGTSVVVSTGIARSFSLGEVTVTPVTAWGTAAEFWVNSISGSTMVINVDAAPGASVDFVWMVDTENRNL